MLSDRLTLFRKFVGQSRIIAAIVWERLAFRWSDSSGRSHNLCKGFEGKMISFPPSPEAIVGCRARQRLPRVLTT